MPKRKIHNAYLDVNKTAKKPKPPKSEYTPKFKVVIFALLMSVVFNIACAIIFNKLTSPIHDCEKSTGMKCELVARAIL